MKKVLFLLMVLCIPVSVRASSLYYVSKDGDDTKTCVQAEPCLTIAKGISKMAGGDTLTIGAGVYDEVIECLPRALFQKLKYELYYCQKFSRRCHKCAGRSSKNYYGCQPYPPPECRTEEFTDDGNSRNRGCLL